MKVKGVPPIPSRSAEKILDLGSMRTMLPEHPPGIGIGGALQLARKYLTGELRPAVKCCGVVYGP